MAQPLAVHFLLEDTPLFGGVKVVLQIANLLTRRGHRVTVISRGEAPAWFPLEASFRRSPDLDPGELPPADVVVATYWSTIPVALAADAVPAHYCQGFEYNFNHNREAHPQILELYRQPLPALTVAPHLTEELGRRFGRPSRVIPQPLEPFFRPSFRWRPHRRPRIALASPFEIDWKGVRTGLLAIDQLRRRGCDCQLVRLSQWPLSDEERELLAPEEFHHGLAPAQIPALLQGCDLLLAPSWEPEGFGLPVLEAMACGLPVVASDISSFRYATRGAARLVPFDQPTAFADAAFDLLSGASRWRRARRAGLRCAARFGERPAVEAAEAALLWIARGEWRQELSLPRQER